jgi:predicted transcriptional regulator
LKAVQLAVEWARKNETLSNPFRALLLAIIVSMESATWNEIWNRLEEVWGEFNPNTLAFHLNRLVEAELVAKIPMGDRYTYRPTPTGIKRTREEAGELLKELGERDG